MGVVARGVCVPVLVVFVLALGGAQAHAATYDFSVSPSPPNAGQTATLSLVSDSADGETVMWDLDGQGGFEASGQTVTHIFPEPGPARVRMRVFDSEGHQSTVSKNVAVNGAPTVDFGFAPAAPLTGAGIAFSPAVTDAEGDGVTLAWDFGDGTSGAGSAPTHAYAAAGTYSVTLTATDEHGASGFATRAVTVRDPAPPPQDPTPPAGTAPVRRLLMMRPFPIVRIAGVVLPTGADVRILSVRAPLGARIRATCSGRGCPTGAVARTSATRVVRFHRFERRLRAGVTLELFVRKAGRIGKYTRFLIRAGKPPARIDRCLVPGRRRPVRCG